MSDAAVGETDGIYAPGDLLAYQSVHEPLVVWLRGDDGSWWGSPDHEHPAADEHVTHSLSDGGSRLIRVGTPAGGSSSRRARDARDARHRPDGG